MSISAKDGPLPKITRYRPNAEPFRFLTLSIWSTVRSALRYVTWGGVFRLGAWGTSFLRVWLILSRTVLTDEFLRATTGSASGGGVGCTSGRGGIG